MNDSTDVRGADVPDVISKEPTQLGVDAPQFVINEKYSSFRAEVAVLEGDFVFHFYLPKGGVKDYTYYWEDLFPTCLDFVARDYFKVSYPRIKAMHIKELGIDSWWMRAYGFVDSTLNPDAFVEKFYQKLHSALESQNRT